MMFLILFVLAIGLFMFVDECFFKNIKLERKLETKKTELSKCNKIITQQKELIETLKIEEQKAKGNYESLRKGFVYQFRHLERKNKILEEQEIRLKQLEEQNQYYSELINQLKKQQQEYLNRFSNINNLTNL